MQLLSAQAAQQSQTKQYCFLYTTNDGQYCEKPCLPWHWHTIQMLAGRRWWLKSRKRRLKQQYGSVRMVFYFKQGLDVHSFADDLRLLTLEVPPSDGVL